MKSEDIALVDLDGTIADYDGALLREMEKMHGPEENPIDLVEWRDKNKVPDHIFARMELIKSDSEWWRTLPVISHGMDVVNLMMEMGFRIVVLTQGPRLNSSAWKGKLEWIHENLPEGTDTIITRDKGLVYGKVLFDDYPKYLQSWLRFRPRGLGIMNAHPTNANFLHPNVIRYSNNIEEIKKELKNQIER